VTIDYLARRRQIFRHNVEDGGPDPRDIVWTSLDDEVAEARSQPIRGPNMTKATVASQARSLHTVFPGPRSGNQHAAMAVQVVSGRADHESVLVTGRSQSLSPPLTDEGGVGWIHRHGLRVASMDGRIGTGRSESKGVLTP